MWGIKSYWMRPIDFNSGAVCKFWPLCGFCPFLGPHFAELWNPKHIHSVILIKTAKHIVWGIKSYQIWLVDFNFGVVCKFWTFLGPFFANWWSYLDTFSYSHSNGKTYHVRYQIISNEPHRFQFLSRWQILIIFKTLSELMKLWIYSISHTHPNS